MRKTAVAEGVPLNAPSCSCPGHSENINGQDHDRRRRPGEYLNASDLAILRSLMAL